MAEDKVAKLELRIKQLEDQLTGFRGTPPADLTADEIRVYQKVSTMMAANCAGGGIYECVVCTTRCLLCIRCVQCLPRCWGPCWECTCGPCLATSSGGGGMGRFSGLGDE